MPENTRSVGKTAKEEWESQLKRTSMGREVKYERKTYTRDTNL